MEIDDYSFGNIVIDGDSYSNDVIIFPDRVHDNWWRDEGHKLQEEDLDLIVDSDYDKLIIGNGFNGRMKVPEETKDFLEEKDISFEIYESSKAWKIFNERDDVVGAFHITC